ncbi:MAG: hypothetical protein WD906_09560 [Anaerolineales bacterium]
MRITRQKLIDLARRHAEATAAESGLLSAYLTGSVVTGEPLLGGSADVDVVLIHESAGPPTREIVHLSDDVHLDIAHHARTLYANPRAIRIDPWLGPAVCEPVFLYDPDHFFEWAQAGARGQFHRADYVAARARGMLEAARTVAPGSSANGAADWLDGYLEAAQRGANAVALLTGFPVWGRRISLGLQQKAQALGRPEVYDGFLRLLGAEGSVAWDLPGWIAAWARAVDLASAHRPAPDLHPSRRTYLLRGFQALVEAGRPEAVLWLLLVTWSQALTSLDGASGDLAARETFQRTLEALQLAEPNHPSRAEELESYLDHVETILETWAVQNGA